MELYTNTNWTGWYAASYVIQIARYRISVR